MQYGTKFRFMSFCCKDVYVTFEYCSFMFYACFLFIYICSVKVMKSVWQSHHQACPHCWCFFMCVSSLHIRMTYYLHDITQLRVEPD
jgi:hypothetical protein